MRQAIIWTNVDPVHWGIYVARGGNELIIKTAMLLLKGTKILYYTSEFCTVGFMIRCFENKSDHIYLHVFNYLKSVGAL